MYELVIGNLQYNLKVNPTGYNENSHLLSRIKGNYFHFVVVEFIKGIDYGIS